MWNWTAAAVSNTIKNKIHHTTTTARNEEKLKNAMRTVDGHSSGTMDRHYWLRDHTADVDLAKMLVKEYKKQVYSTQCIAHSVQYVILGTSCVYIYICI